jgi:hypothetical protein
MIVELTHWEYHNASHVATMRTVYNWSSKDAVHYKRDRMEDDRTANLAAAVCELAVAKTINEYWHGSAWHPVENKKFAATLPDVGHDIEVRRSRNKRTVAARRKQLGQGLYLFGAECVDEELRVVDVWGWLPYDEAWELGSPSSYNEDTRVVARDLFNRTTFRRS